MSYLEKDIRKLIGKAIHQYDLIKDGDRILVALSGGKDSLVMLKVLHERKPRVPIDYDLQVLTVDLGYGGSDWKELRSYIKDLGYEHILKKTKIGPLAHSERNRENPCFLCAWLRRKVIFETARDLGCSKVALGHNRDDIIVTFLLNTFYGGELSAMVPHQVLFKGKLTLIRPLALLEEDTIRAYAEQCSLPQVQNGCPSKGTTRRKTIKSLLEELDRIDPRIKKNIFSSLSNVKAEYLLNGFKTKP